MIRILSLGAFLVVATQLVASPQNGDDSPATMLPKVRVRGDDLDMTVTADPGTKCVVAITVDEVTPNSLAAKLGVRVGWQIEKVAGIPVTQLKVEDVDGDKLNQGQAIRFISPKIMGIYRKVLTLSFTRKDPARQTTSGS